MIRVAILVTVLAWCFSASAYHSWFQSRGPKLGAGKRLDATLVDRTKAKASTNAVVIADGIWKRKPGGLFGRKFGESIPNLTALKHDRERDEFYVSFQPAKRFRSFADYRLIVDPRTRLVYGISCVERVNKEECQKELNEIKEIFKQKFPKASSTGCAIGYEDEGGGWAVARWNLAFEVKHPDKKGRRMTPSEIIIRANDAHFHPSIGEAKPEASPDVEAL